MSAATRRRRVIGCGGFLTHTALMAVCAVTAFGGAPQGAEQRPASKAASLSGTDRKKLMAERDRLSKESNLLEAQGKYAEAIGAAEKLLAIQRQISGDMTDDVAGSLDVIGRCHLARDELAAARKAFTEALSIRLKLHGEDDWRSIDSRLQIRGVDLRGHLTSEQRRELAGADQAMSQSRDLERKGEIEKVIPLARRALESRQRLFGEDPEAATASTWLASLYKTRGNYSEAERLYQRALEIREHILGKQHPATAESLNDLIDLYESHREYAKAEPLYREMLEIQKKRFGERHSATAKTLINLAMLYRSMEDHAKAEPLFRQALELFKNIPYSTPWQFEGERQPDTAAFLDRLAYRYSHGWYVNDDDQALRNDHAKAEALYREAVEIRTKVLGEKNPKTADAINELASWYESIDEDAKAEPLYRQALEIRKETLGEQHPDTVKSVNEMASLYLQTGNYAKAEPLYRRAFEIRKETLGEHHRETLTSLGKLIGCYDEMGQYGPAETLLRHAFDSRTKGPSGQQADAANSRDSLFDLSRDLSDMADDRRRNDAVAERLYQQALEIRKKILGEEDLGTVSILNKLAGRYAANGDQSKAEPLQRRATEIENRARDRRDLERATDLNIQAAQYRSLGEYIEAERLYRGSLELRMKVLGNQHPDTATSMNNLASLYQLMGEYDQAEPLYRQALEIREKVLGERHADTVANLRTLAGAYVSNKDYAKAEPLYRQVLKSDTTVSGEQHPSVATDLVQLAGLYKEMGKYAEAESDYRQALAIRRKILGDRHPDTKSSLDGLADCLSLIAKQQIEKGNFASARKASGEAVAILTGSYGANDWRVTDARLALEDVEKRSRLSPEQRRELLQADQANPQFEALYERPDFQQADFAQATQLAEHAAEIRRRILGKQHVDTAESLNNLAVMYQRMGDYAKAEPLYRQALETEKKLLGEQHPSTAETIHNLASLYKEMGRYAEAETYYREAFAIRKRLLGDQDAATKRSLNGFLDLLSRLAKQQIGKGDLASARKAREEVLAMQAERYGANNWRVTTARLTLTDLDLLGRLAPEQRRELVEADEAMSQVRDLNRKGNAGKAIPVAKRAMEIRQRILGNEHPQTTASCYSLGWLYKSVGTYTEAEAYYRRALEADQKVFGPEHPETATDLSDLAGLFESMGDYAKAESLFRQALEIREKVLGPKDKDTAASCNNLALVYYSRKEYAEAEPLFRWALAIREKVLGERSPDTLTSLRNLAQAYWSQNDYAKADLLCRQLLAIDKRVFGEQHPSTATALDDLAALCKETGKYAEAETYYRQALAIRRKVLGEGNPVTKNTLDGLADLLSRIARQQIEKGDFAAARKAGEEALAIRTQRYGAKDWRVTNAQLGLRDVDYQARLTPEQRRALLDADNAMSQVRDLNREGESAGAIPLAKRAADIRQQLLGNEHPATATSLYWLGVLNESIWKYTQAAAYYRRALQADKKVLGDDHPDTVPDLMALSALYKKMEKYAEVEPLLRQALAARRRTLGDGHPDTKKTLLELADLLSRIAKQQIKEALEPQTNEKTLIASARKAREEALAILTKAYGANNWRVTDARLALRDVDVQSRLSRRQRREVAEADGKMAEARYLDRQGESGKAIARGNEALDVRRRLLKNEDPDPETAASCYWLGRRYHDQGVKGYEQAERLYQEALEIRKKILGEDHPDTVRNVNDLATLYQERLDWDWHRDRDWSREGRKMLGLFAALGKVGVPDQQRRELVDAEQAMSQVRDLELKGKANEAIPLANHALETCKLLGNEQPATATAYSWLGKLYFDIGNYARAETHLRQALEIRTKVLGEQKPDTATSLNNLAELYRSIGEYEKARPLCQRALEIRQKILGEQDPDTAQSLNNLARLYEAIGEYDEAERLYLHALEIFKTVLGEDDPDTAQCRNNLGALYLERQDYARAEAMFLQAKEINKTVLGKQHPFTASSLNNLAEVYWAMGQYGRAEPLCQEALSIRKTLQAEHPDTSTSLNNLALVFESMGDYAKAEPLFQQAQALLRKTMGERWERHPRAVTSLTNLALLYASMGKYAKAEPLLRQALMNSQRELIETFSILSESEQLALDARLRFGLDTYLSVAGTPEYRADAGPQAVSDAEVYRYVLLGKGVVTAQQSFIHVTLRAKNAKELRPLFEELQADSRQLQNLSPSTPEKAEQMEAWRKQEISRLEKELKTDQQKLAAQSGEFRRLEESLQADANQVKNLQELLPAKAALVDFLEYTHFSPPPLKKGPLSPERRLVAFVVRRAAPVKRIDLGPVKPLADAANCWRKAIDNAGGGSESLASQPGVEGVSHKPPQQLLRERLVDPLQPSLQGVNLLLISPDGFLNQVPFAALPGREKGKYLLEELQVATVPDPRELPALLDSHSADSSQQPSLLLMGGLDYDKKTATPSVAENDVATPLRPRRAALRGATGYFFPPLVPGTLDEIDEIDSMFREHFAARDSRELKPLKKTGATGTVDVFRSEAQRHRWIHLATHGFFSGKDLDPDEPCSGTPPSPDSRTSRDAQQDQPDDGLAGQNRTVDPGLLSGIAFAGANRASELTPGLADSSSEEADDGILTALEVAELDLRNVDMVVLSACQTGLGRVAGGEGVLGLQRAFQVAGAKTCITSLWKVDNSATQLLMKEFYGNLWGIDPLTKKPRKQLGKLDALRQAQSTMLRQYDPLGKTLAGLEIPVERSIVPRRASPFYWAAFVLSGDWR